MDLEFINQEISEARLFRTTGGFRNISGPELADLLYLNVLVSYTLMQDNTQSVFAREYLKQTTIYASFGLFRTHATDLYMLIFAASNPENDNLKFKNPAKDKKYLRSLKLDPHYLRKQLRKMHSNEGMSGAEAMRFFYRLEKQLKITDSRYKRWRRLATDWSNLKYPQKQLVIAQSVQELRRRGHGSGSELIPSLTGMLKYKQYKDLAKEPKPEKPSTLKRAAATAAGAVAGRALANKLNGLTPDKAKNIGTGLGAIAGFWASGRQRK